MSDLQLTAILVALALTPLLLMGWSALILPERMKLARIAGRLRRQDLSDNERETLERLMRYSSSIWPTVFTAVSALPISILALSATPRDEAAKSPIGQISDRDGGAEFIRQMARCMFLTNPLFGLLTAIQAVIVTTVSVVLGRSLQTNRLFSEVLLAGIPTKLSNDR